MTPTVPRPAAGARQPPPSTSRRSGRTSRSCRAACATASRWSTWTTAATSQKPRRCSTPSVDYYERHNAALDRGADQLAEEATDAYEGARARTPLHRRPEADEIVFTQRPTESINLVAYALSNAATAQDRSRRYAVGQGDEIVVTEMEHHANLTRGRSCASAPGRRCAGSASPTTAGSTCPTSTPSSTTDEVVAVTQSRTSSAR